MKKAVSLIVGLLFIPEIMLAANLTCLIKGLEHLEGSVNADPSALPSIKMQPLPWENPIKRPAFYWNINWFYYQKLPFFIDSHPIIASRYIPSNKADRYIGICSLFYSHHLLIALHHYHSYKLFRRFCLTGANSFPWTSKWPFVII